MPRTSQSEFSPNKSNHSHNLLELATKDLLHFLKNKYGSERITHRKYLSKKEINDELNKMDPSFGISLENENSSIKPDGGLIFIDDHLILVSEMKKQGVNKQRLRSGEKKQSMGNAIERAFKNAREIENYCINKKYFPYVVFVHGCDFEPQSSMRDRISSANLNSPINNTYVKDIGHHKRTSLFIQEKPYTRMFLFNILKKIAGESIEILKIT